MLAWPLFLVYLGLAAAFLVRLVAPSAYAFATVSNLTYGMAGLACTPALQTPGRRNAGATPRGALPLLILGAASAAHHARPRSGLAAHHLDITFGWFLVAHLAHSSIAVAARFLVALCGGRAGGTLDRVTDASMYALLAAGAVFLFSHYDTLYDDQITLYLSLGITCAVITGLARLLLAHDEDDNFTLASLGMAFMETTVIAVALVAAVFVQGELLGRDIASDGMANENYNLYHGSWHFLIAAVAVIVYVRLADVEALIDAIARGVPAEPVTQWNGVDVLALSMLSTYASAVWALKETNAHVDLALVLVGAYLAFALLVTVALQAFPRVYSARRKAEPLETFVPLGAF